MDFTKIESEEYTQLLTHCGDLSTLLRAAWKTPELESLWEFSKTEENRTQIIERLGKLPPQRYATEILYVYVVDMRDARIGAALLGKITKENPWSFALWDRVIRKAM